MGEFRGKSHCWPKRTQMLVSHLPKIILIIPKTFGQIFCGLMRQKFNFMAGVCPITSDVKPTQHFIKRTSYQQSNMVVVVVWWSGAVCDLKLKHTLVMQQDNNPKLTSKSTSEWLKINKIKVLEWPSQSYRTYPIEMLWHDLKQSFHAWKPSNVAELKQICKEVWAKIPPQWCETHLPVIANAWLQLLLQRVPQPVIRFRGQLLFHARQGRFGQLFFP